VSPRAPTTTTDACPDSSSRIPRFVNFVRPLCATLQGAQSGKSTFSPTRMSAREARPTLKKRIVQRKSPRPFFTS